MRAPTDQEIERAESMVNGNSSPKIIWGAMSTMADTLGVRGGQLQRVYTKVMGKPYTEMLDPDVDKTMKMLGVDTRKMNGFPADAPKSDPPPPKAPAEGGQHHPLGATREVMGPDGKIHWTNDTGTHDYGVKP
jgi:hypothetical protein